MFNLLQGIAKLVVRCEKNADFRALMENVKAQKVKNSCILCKNIVKCTKQNVVTNIGETNFYLDIIFLIIKI